MAQAALTYGSRAVADMMIEQLLAPGAPKSLRDEWHAVMSRTPPAGVAAAARALAGRPDSLPTLPQIDCPTLLVFGAQDALTPPALGEEMRERIVGARLAVIPGAGHLPPVEQPAAFAASLRGFLEQIA
jgi:3-oxoadipate enol-lactonase